MSAAATSRLDVARTPARAAAGEPADADALLEPWFSCLRQRLPDVQIFDCHTHLGSDLDGSGQSPGELRATWASCRRAASSSRWRNRTATGRPTTG